MPKAFPLEFRRDVVAVARHGGASMAQVAKDFGISESCLNRWVKLAEQHDQVKGNPQVPPSAELAMLRKRTKLLEQENEILRRATAYFARDTLPK